MIVVVWFILHIDILAYVDTCPISYCIVVLVFSFVCYTCEIARIGKPCVVALYILVLTLFLSSFYISVYTLAHMNLQLTNVYLLHRKYH